MKQLIILLAVVLLAGCNPCKRLARKCPPVIQYDSVYIEKIILDTVVYTIPGDTVRIEMRVKVPLTDLQWKEETNDQIVSIKIEDGVMEVVAICKADSLELIIKSLRTELKVKKESVSSTPEPEKKLGKFAKFTIIFFFCVVFLVIVLLV